ncbi:iron-siderophore ABC transporter substrate-binding protein [Cyanobacterium aponinum UTEX 3222]|uniref:ABC transporter substrate-binding protein n=1 Tax=Cyanobacterium aponinum TaxID=379064 RepID=UPI00308A12B8|nr:iron-siderophore ABC transporter substrate-binding protein [Cyanobacterium aponinum UTEX 3222]
MITLLCITACGKQTEIISFRQTEQEFFNCRIVQHNMEEISICDQPQKIVTLSMHMLDILLSLEQQPTGYAPVEPINQRQFNNPATQIPYLGQYLKTKPINVGTRSNPSIETLVNIKPDLILGELGFNQDEYEFLSRLAPTMLFDGSKKNQWQSSIIEIAKALNQSDQARRVIADYERYLEEAKSNLASVILQYPKLLLIGSGGLREGVQVRNGSDFTGGLLEDLGFQLVFPDNLDSGIGEVPISLEALSSLDVDLVIVQAWNDQENAPLSKVKEEWEQIPILQSMPVSQLDNVYFVDYQLWSISRGPIAARLILDQLHKLLLE